MKFETQPTPIKDNRSPEQRVEDAGILVELRKSGFLKQISIDTDAVLRALAEWQRTGDRVELAQFFRSNQDKSVAKEFGPNGLEAMDIILEEIEEIKDIAA